MCREVGCSRPRRRPRVVVPAPKTLLGTPVLAVLLPTAGADAPAPFASEFSDHRGRFCCRELRERISFAPHGARGGWKIQAWPEAWEWLLRRHLSRSLSYVFIRTLASFAKPREVLLVHGSDVGVHISTNEEVAVKLVRPHTDAHYQDDSRAVPLTQVSGRVRAGVSVGWQLLCSAAWQSICL